jgi:NifU-like protein involved in Fe-S cluster formation
VIDDLYSARILKLAANMPRAGRLAAPQGSAERISKLCGSRARVDVVLKDGRIADYAQEVEACALGQATAAIVGANVIGAEVCELEAARDAMRAMLKSGGAAPGGRFAELSALEQVKDFPARHASSMVALEAACDAARSALRRTTSANAA